MNPTTITKSTPKVSPVLTAASVSVTSSVNAATSAVASVAICSTFVTPSINLQPSSVSLITQPLAKEWVEFDVALKAIKPLDVKDQVKAIKKSVIAVMAKFNALNERGNTAQNAIYDLLNQCDILVTRSKYADIPVNNDHPVKILGRLEALSERYSKEIGSDLLKVYSNMNKASGMCQKFDNKIAYQSGVEKIHEKVNELNERMGKLLDSLPARLESIEKELELEKIALSEANSSCDDWFILRYELAKATTTESDAKLILAEIGQVNDRVTSSVTSLERAHKQLSFEKASSSQSKSKLMTTMNEIWTGVSSLSKTANETLSKAKSLPSGTEETAQRKQLKEWLVDLMEIEKKVTKYRNELPGLIQQAKKEMAEEVSAQNSIEKDALEAIRKAQDEARGLMLDGIKTATIKHRSLSSEKAPRISHVRVPTLTNVQELKEKAERKKVLLVKFLNFTEGEFSLLNRIISSSNVGNDVKKFNKPVTASFKNLLELEDLNQNETVLKHKVKTISIVTKRVQETLEQLRRDFKEVDSVKKDPGIAIDGAKNPPSSAFGVTISAKGAVTAAISTKSALSNHPITSTASSAVVDKEKELKKQHAHTSIVSSNATAASAVDKSKKPSTIDEDAQVEQIKQASMRLLQQVADLRQCCEQCEKRAVDNHSTLVEIADPKTATEENAAYERVVALRKDLDEVNKRLKQLTEFAEEANNISRDILFADSDRDEICLLVVGSLARVRYLEEVLKRPFQITSLMLSKIEKENDSIKSEVNRIEEIQHKEIAQYRASFDSHKEAIAACKKHIENRFNKVSNQKLIATLFSQIFSDEMGSLVIDFDKALKEIFAKLFIYDTQFQSFLKNSPASDKQQLNWAAILSIYKEKFDASNRLKSEVDDIVSNIDDQYEKIGEKFKQLTGQLVNLTEELEAREKSENQEILKSEQIIKEAEAEMKRVQECVEKGIDLKDMAWGQLLESFKKDWSINQARLNENHTLFKEAVVSLRKFVASAKYFAKELDFDQLDEMENERISKELSGIFYSLNSGFVQDREVNKFILLIKGNVEKMKSDLEQFKKETALLNLIDTAASTTATAASAAASNAAANTAASNK